MAYIKGFSWRGIALSAPTTLLIVATGVGALGAGHYEPPSFTAAQVLSANLQHGANYSITSHVGLDNFQNTFSVKAIGGRSPSRGAIFCACALGRSPPPPSFRKSGSPRPRSEQRDALRFSRSPPRTLSPLPAIGDTFRGVGHIFGSADAAMNATDPRQLRDALRDKPPAELEKDGRQILASTGISEAAMNAFYGDPNLTPTDKAIIVEAFNSLGGVGDREKLGQ